MRIWTFLTIVATLLLLGGASLATATAQTPEASPVAAGWQVTDVRGIAVEGEPVVLSPDGQRLAGTSDDGNAVCAWDVATLTPICAEVAKPVKPALGYMALRWSPDSTAVAFVSGDRNALIFGNVLVFEVESGELVNLTNSDETIEDPMYIGADWTADSSQVIAVAYFPLRDQGDADALFRIDRGGGEPVAVPLPARFASFRTYAPPLAVGNDAALVTIEANGDAGGVWRVPFDGSDPVQLVPGTGASAIPRPLVASISRDGRYASVVSLGRMMQFETEDTYFIVDLATGDAVPLASDIEQLMVTFAPGGDTGLTMIDLRLATVNPVSGAMQPVANSPEIADSWLMHIPIWASNDTVFLPGDGGGTLVALAPAA